MHTKVLAAFLGLSIGMLSMYSAYPYIPLIPNIRKLFYIAPPFDDVIPNEETASQVADVIVRVYYSDKNYGFDLNSLNDADVKCHVDYNESENAWVVWHEKISPIEGISILGGGLPEITIRKDDGTIVRIGLSE